VCAFQSPDRKVCGGKRPVTLDDAFAASVTFENGAIGTLEATRFVNGRRNHNAIEINGEKGSLAFKGMIRRCVGVVTFLGFLHYVGVLPCRTVVL
jgi:predicted dehydrogenase